MYEIKEGTAKIDNISIPVFKREVYACNSLDVVAGTNGYKGGDSGHGSRTFVKIVDTGGTDIRVKEIPESRDTNGGFELILGGDSELHTAIKAFKFIAKALEEMAKEVDE